MLASHGLKKKPFFRFWTKINNKKKNFLLKIEKNAKNSPLCQPWAQISWPTYFIQTWGLWRETQNTVEFYIYSRWRYSIMCSSPISKYTQLFIRSSTLFENASLRSKIFLTLLKTLFRCLKFDILPIKKRNLKRLWTQNPKKPFLLLDKNKNPFFAS